MGAGRPSVFDKKIKPFFDKIVEWRENGATERDIAKRLDVAILVIILLPVEQGIPFVEEKLLHIEVVNSILDLVEQLVCHSLHPCCPPRLSLADGGQCF